MIKQRIRIQDEKGSMVTIGYLMADYLPTDETIVSIGISVCHKTDEFDREKGETLAFERLLRPLETTRIRELDCDCGCGHRRRDEYSIRNQLDNFIDRCFNYYKDRNVILPKIKIT